jgi:hypothetical protein
MKAAIFALLLLTDLACAQTGWQEGQSHAASQSEARKLVNDFGGWLIITSDADWEAKWATPSDSTPNFTEVKRVTRGDHIFILTFFANPKLDSAGKASLTCDIDVIRPDGRLSTHQKNAVCFKGVIDGNPHNLYLSDPVIGFAGEAGDPAGEWVVRVTLKDDIRNVRMSLKASFVLQ